MFIYNHPIKVWTKAFICLGYLATISFLFTLLFSYSTSFLYTLPIPINDSAIFQTIGKYWNEGLVPYINLWDHKGPIIFFINAIGYFFTGSKTGVFIIQTVSLYISLLYLYKLFRLSYNHVQSCLFVLFSIVYLSYSYEGGNLTEEYILPLLCISFYYLFRWVAKNGETLHSYKYSAIYGVTFGFALMTRLTNAVGVCFAFLFLLFFYSVKKEWKVVMRNIIAFIIGVLILVIPFVVYFYINNALDELYYATLLFNIEYANKPNPDSLHLPPFMQLRNYIAYSGSFLLFFMGFILIKFKDACRFRGYLWLLVGASTSFLLIKVQAYPHYGMIALPYLAIVLLEIKEIGKNKNWFSKMIKGIIYFYIILLCFGFLTKANHLRFIQDSDCILPYKQMLEKIPKEERSSFVAYNCPPYIYTNLDIKPSRRFFILQDFQSSFSVTMKKQMLYDYEYNPTTWILIYKKGTLTIQQLIDKKYRLQSSDSINSLYLYKLKNEI